MSCIQCNKESKMRWCSMKCKEDFYRENYLGSVLVEILEKEHKEKWKKMHDKAMKEWKASGLDYCEYLLSLGDFKEDEDGALM